MPKPTLTDMQRRRYKLEKVTNFRFIAKLFADKANYVLSSRDFAPLSLQLELSDIGQFTEIVHGWMSPTFVWRNLKQLMREGFPLEMYSALPGTMLVACFLGRIAKEQAMVVYRPTMKQLLVTFSGTSSVASALRDIEALKKKYPLIKESRARVHRGFWRIYAGVREQALQAMGKGFQEHEARELVVCGHSLGAVQATYFVLDLLLRELQSSSASASSPAPSSSSSSSTLPAGIHIKFVTFGTPRPGDKNFQKLYREKVAEYRTKFGEESFKEYAVVAYNDGVSALPPKKIGYCHAVERFLYLHHGCLYYCPPAELEHTRFRVNHDEDGYASHPPDFPLGGHNYYNGRDMEALSRRMQWLDAIGAGELPANWEHRYKKRYDAEQRKLSGEQRVIRMCAVMEMIKSSSRVNSRQFSEKLHHKTKPNGKEQQADTEMQQKPHPLQATIMGEPTVQSPLPQDSPPILPESVIDTSPMGLPQLAESMANSTTTTTI